MTAEIIAEKAKSEVSESFGGFWCVEYLKLFGVAKKCCNGLRYLPELEGTTVGKVCGGVKEHARSSMPRQA